MSDLLAPNIYEVAFLRFHKVRVSATTPEIARADVERRFSLQQLFKPEGDKILYVELIPKTTPADDPAG